MAQNILGAYSPIFYAQETLAHLRKNLGMAARVYRGYEAERNSFGRGDTIVIRKPATFVVQDAPSSSQDLNTQSVNIVLDQWKEVKFELSDKERAFTGERIISEHIEPAAYAIADGIDIALARLYRDIPYIYDYGSSTDHTIITGARKILFDNQVPLDGRLHFMIDSTLEQYFLNASTNLIGTAPNATENALLRGSLGTRYGVEVFANQNVQQHTPGTASQTAGDKVGAVNVAAGLTRGATSVVVSGFTGAETIKAGDNFVIAGHTQRYAVTADVTLSGGAGTISFTPAAVQNYPNASVITLATAPSDGAHSANLMFHENAFALAMAPLPMDLPGIEAFTVSDPVSGLSVRARRFSDGDNSKLIMALDVLFGVKTMDPNMAVRAET